MNRYKIGLDIGSTTIKIVLLDENNSVLYHDYLRHFSNIKTSLLELVKSCYEKVDNLPCTIGITGSGGLSIASWLKIPFIQEVIGCTRAVEERIPQTDVVIELGGEDAKITYFTGTMEQRMNGNCAGGTGAFIDQMASLLNTNAQGLNEYAKKHKVIHPIASRCGVFAKTDIQPLINDGACKDDIAASIFQAVVNQTIGGLACGKPICGKVAFLGGPLTFLSQLRQRFIESLQLSHDDIIFPEYSHLFVAIGAALLSDKEPLSTLVSLIEKLETTEEKIDQEEQFLEPLFKNQEEYQKFLQRHQFAQVTRTSITEYKGNGFLGVDAGSTTTKVVLLSESKELLYSFYGSNEGDPFQRIITILQDLYSKMPEEMQIAKAVVTGYGESFIKSAFHMDMGEIETIAHCKAAAFFLPEVDFILDIGGQDMKCIRLKDGVIDGILLNEACSSGCGSFLEGFAHSLNRTVEEFSKEALFSKSPVNLGSKCTVFMNSKVKQAQKEGVEISDLSAGLAYSVIKNALFKVIKIRNKEDLGKKIMVQGGTFYNDAVLRAFELVSGQEAVRPEISGLMGAFGAALIGIEEYKEGDLSRISSKEELNGFCVKTHVHPCGKCGNHCLLTTNIFSNGESFVAGNRCERGLGIGKVDTMLPNLYSYKYHRTFSYIPLPTPLARRGVIGIPRVLNMYENYPFWFSFFTKLGFQVILSPPSSKILYEKGIGTIPSESVCYPAKLCHGHIHSLIEKGIKVIFFPSVVREHQEFHDATNHYNCPVVTSYPEVIKNNMEELKENQIQWIAPFLSLDNMNTLARRMFEELKGFQITFPEVKKAVETAKKERIRYTKDIQKKGEEVCDYLQKHNKKAIVLCGKPYHIDPEIHHGIPELIQSLGMAVLTEDSISHLAPLSYKLRVVDQWVYNSRLYRAASYLKGQPAMEMVQLNSFGCGLDAVTTDQVEEILASGGKMYTMLKIDEGSNLGAAKIRLRSLKAAMEERERKGYRARTIDIDYQPPLFTKQMKKSHTILAPQMSPIHFELLQVAIRTSGYKLEVLSSMDMETVEEGLKYVNQDACYPAIITVGQIIHSLKSGKYDLNHTSVIISQTGGGCRATNYIGFLKLALKEAGFETIPIISLNVVGLGKQPGFQLSRNLINRCIMALVYGDLFMKVLYRTRPYEKKIGASNELYKKWNIEAKRMIEKGNKRDFHEGIKRVIKEFDALELKDVKKPKVAIVGEILIKYHPMANNNIIEILEAEGAEVVVPDFLDFFYYSAFNTGFQYKYLSGNRINYEINQWTIKYLNSYQKVMKESLKKSNRFSPSVSIQKLATLASPFLSLGNQTGEGWLVTAEMIEFINNGVNNILCVQPLACLPNHIVGKGMLKPLREAYPQANIMPIDYDPGTSKVNQLNRIKLMMGSVKKYQEEKG